MWTLQPSAIISVHLPPKLSLYLCVPVAILLAAFDQAAFSFPKSSVSCSLVPLEICFSGSRRTS